MLRPLHPTDRIRLVMDPSASGYSVPIQVQGPRSVIMSGCGSFTAQVNNSNMFSTRQDYGVAQSRFAIQQPQPTLNSSFSANWADTSVTGDASSAAAAFAYINFNVRHIRVKSASISSASAVYGYAFARPRA